MPFDFDILYALQALHGPVLDALAVAVSSLGNGSIAWLAMAAVLFARRKTRRAGIAVLVALVAEAVAVELVLKPLIARPRPFMVDASIDLLVAAPRGWSCPSGHAASSFAAAVAIFASLPRGSRRWAAPALVLAALIALSRPYLFVHFPSDVLLGALVGAVIGWASAALVARWRRAGRDGVSAAAD